MVSHKTQRKNIHRIFPFGFQKNFYESRVVLVFFEYGLAAVGSIKNMVGNVADYAAGYSSHKKSIS